MENNLKEIIVLNGPMMVRVEGDHIQISAYQHEARLPFLPKDTPDSIMGVVGHRKGGSSYILTSDVFDCFNLKFKEKRLDKDSMHDIIYHLLESSIQFIAKISKEENLPVLIQNSYDEKSTYFLSTIGLLDDTRIIFAEITPSLKRKVGEITTC